MDCRHLSISYSRLNKDVNKLEKKEEKLRKKSDYYKKQADYIKEKIVEKELRIDKIFRILYTIAMNNNN